MKAVDTNDVVRLMVKDDPLQTPVAFAIFEQPVFLSQGVLIETEWVLRNHYRWPRDRISDAFGELLRIETVTTKDFDLLLWCLDRYRVGADLADMLHIVSARETDAFPTFDRGLGQAVGVDAPLPVELLA